MIGRVDLQKNTVMTADKQSLQSPDLKIFKLESRIEAIERRNREVEINKSWEGSWTRRLLIIFFTYFSIALYLKFIVGIEPWVNSVVPSLGFLLSTLTLPYFKEFWKKYLHRRD